MMPFAKMASLEEVQNRQSEQKPQKPWQVSEGQRRLLKALGHAGEIPDGRVAFEVLVADLKAKKWTDGEAF
jgi:hypothetical protein